jgi:hypothetical protein
MSALAICVDKLMRCHQRAADRPFLCLPPDAPCRSDLCSLGLGSLVHALSHFHYDSRCLFDGYATHRARRIALSEIVLQVQLMPPRSESLHRCAEK